MSGYVGKQDIRMLHVAAVEVDSAALAAGASTCVSDVASGYLTRWSASAQCCRFRVTVRGLQGNMVVGVVIPMEQHIAFGWRRRRKVDRMPGYYGGGLLRC